MPFNTSSKCKSVCFFHHRAKSDCAPCTQPAHCTSHTSPDGVRACSHVQLSATPWTVACQTPLSMGFSRKEYWSGMPFPPPGYHPNPGIKPTSPESPTQVGGFFTTARKGCKIKTQKQTGNLSEGNWECLQTPLAGWGGGAAPSSPSMLTGRRMFHGTN